MKQYKAEYADDEIEVFDEENDDSAWKYACEQESQHGTIFNLFEIDNNYDVIRTIF